MDIHMDKSSSFDFTFQAFDGLQAEPFVSNTPPAYAISVRKFARSLRKQTSSVLYRGKGALRERFVLFSFTFASCARYR